MSTTEDFSHYGDEIDPNQMEIQDTPPTPDEMFRQLMSDHFAIGNLGQWQNPHMWVEYGGGSVTVWNKLNMRYIHKDWVSTKQQHRQEPQTIEAAIEWIERPAANT